MHSFFGKSTFNTKYRKKCITNSSILENYQFGRVMVVAMVIVMNYVIGELS